MEWQNCKFRYHDNLKNGHLIQLRLLKFIDNNVSNIQLIHWYVKKKIKQTEERWLQNKNIRREYAKNKIYSKKRHFMSRVFAFLCLWILGRNEDILHYRLSFKAY